MRKPLEHTVTLDMARTDDQAVVSIPKLDTGRRIIFRLRNGAEAYTLTGAMMAAVSLDRGRYGPRINLPLPKAPDDLQEIAAEIGTRVYGEETEQVVIFEWSKDWSMIAGTFRACLHIVDGSMTDLFSPTFIFEVSDSPYDEFSVRTSPGFTALSEAAKDLRETRDELNEFMDNALTAKQLYEALTGSEPPDGVTLEGALAPLVTEDELTEAVRGLENNLAVDGAVYNALRAFVLQKTLEEMMARYQELLTPELFGALLERNGYFMSYDAVNRRLRATVGGVSMAALMLSGCLTTGGKTRLANYLDHGVFVATDSAAAQIEDDINHLVAELTEAVEHTVNVSLPSLTSYVVSTVSGQSGAAANIAVVVPPAGTTKTVTITPVNGHEITGVNVVGCDYTVTANADGSRTVVLQLTASTESVTVSAQTQLLVHDTNTVSINGSTAIFTGGEYVGTGYKITRTYDTTTEKVTYYVDALSGYRVTASATVNGQSLGSVTEITVGMASSSAVNITVTAVRMVSITVDVDQYTTCVIRTGANLPYTDSKIAEGTTISIELGASADATHIMDAYCDVSISGVSVGSPTESGGKLIYIGAVTGDVNIRARADSKVATVTFVSDNTADFGEIGTLGFVSFAENSKTVEYTRGEAVSVYAKPRVAADFSTTSVIIPSITPAWLVSPKSSTEGGEDDCYIVATSFVRGNVTITVTASGNTVTADDGILTIGGLYAEEADGILDIKLD